MEEETKALTPEELEERIQAIQVLHAKLQEGIVSEGQRVESITYQEEFEILPQNGSYLEFKTDVYFVKMEAEGKMFYDIYSIGQEKIATLSAEGELLLAPEFLETLDESAKQLLGLELRGDLTLDMEELQNRKNARDVEVVFEKEPEKKEEEPVLTKPEAMQKEEIEEDLGIQRGDLAFEADIKDNRFPEIVPEAKDYEGYVKICRVKGSSEVMMIGKSKQTDKFQPLQSIGQAEKTNERPIKLNEEGNEITRENLNGVMRYNDKYAFGYTIDYYGELNLELLRQDEKVEKGYRYLSSGIETRTQYPVKEQIKEVMNDTKNERVGEEIKRYDDLRRDYPNEDIHLSDITDEGGNGIIRLSNGERTSFEEEAKKAKVSSQEFERIYREADGKTPEEKIAEAHEEIERQFGAPNRNREHR